MAAQSKSTPAGGGWLFDILLVVAGGAILAIFAVWPLALYGDRMLWTLVVCATALLLAMMRVSLGHETSAAIESLAVVAGFAAFGPGSASAAAAIAFGYRGWHEGGTRTAARGASGALVGVATMFTLYILLVGGPALGPEISALLTVGGPVAGIRIGFGLLLGGVAGSLVAERLLSRESWAAARRSRRLVSAAATAAIGGALGLAYPVLGGAAIVMMVPIGALAWSVVVMRRAEKGRVYVSVQEKLTSIMVIALSTALIMAVGASGVLFYRDYADAAIDRYRALAEGLAQAGLTQSSSRSPVGRSVTLKIRELVEEDPGLAYAVLHVNDREMAAFAHLKPEWEEFTADIRDRLEPITEPGHVPMVWRSELSQLSVENVSQTIEGEDGELIGTIHLGLDRELLVANVKRMALTLSLILTGTLFLAILAMRRFGTRGLTRPLARISGVVRQLSEGDADLRERMEDGRLARDELGELSHNFNRFMGNLQEIVRTASETSRDVAVSADQVATTADKLNRSSEEISSSMTKVIGRLEREEQQLAEIKDLATRLSEIAKEVATSAERSASASERIQAVAAESTGKVESATDTLIEIRDIVESSSRAIGDLVSTANQVSELVNAIAGIAEQTDLLALNASIEAARAGEHGRGFAVVAAEIRALAEETSSASERAGMIIRGVESKVDEVVGTMNAAREEVAGVEDVSREARAALSQVVEFLAEQMAAIERIAEQMREEARRVGEMQMLIAAVAHFSESNVASAADVSQATQKQTMSMQEIAAGSQELTRSAERLRGLIGKFTT